ncbi:hypothetical protein RIF29_39650 [Crotalaria pallida]|uniref:Late embryogenesis abundant protein LEA-2 subgroup domain-containing protein n=1 Tax=Crotalaria pallida TaxID=3830 RepID=A0AAN9E4N2_CROPI
MNKGVQSTQRPPHYPTPAAPYSGHPRQPYQQARPAAAANNNYSDMSREYNNFANNDSVIDNSPTCGCWRVSKYCLAFLVCVVLLFMVVGWNLNPLFAVYKVESLSVSNFSTDPVLTGIWNISFTVYNPNEYGATVFPEYKVEIIHNASVIAVAYSNETFKLVKFEHRQCDLEAITNSTVLDALADPMAVLEAIKNEQASTGSITINMLTTSTADTDRTHYLAYCADLKLVFLNSSAGTLDNSSQQKLCHANVTTY